MLWRKAREKLRRIKPRYEEVTHQPDAWDPIPDGGYQSLSGPPDHERRRADNAMLPMHARFALPIAVLCVLSAH
jgi:hypothetical protein